MDAANRSIYISIKSGKYYSDARHWYISKYVNTLVERSVVAIIALLLVFSACMVFVFYNSINVKGTQSYISNVMDTSRYFSVIKKIDNSNQSTQEVVVEYLLSEYIKRREKYSFLDIEFQKNYVKENSSEAQYKIFINDLSINNPNSPLVIYQNNASRLVKVHKVNIKNAKEAFVDFSTMIASKINKVEEKVDWVAHIKFDIPMVKYLVESKKYGKMGFVVTFYDVHKVK